MKKDLIFTWRLILFFPLRIAELLAIGVSFAFSIPAKLTADLEDYLTNKRANYYRRHLRDVVQKFLYKD